MSEDKKKKKSGCTTPIIIFVGLLILFVIALPDFLTYSSKDQRSEAKQNLVTIFELQIAYYGEHGYYAGGDNCFETLNWVPKRKTEYNYYCGSDKVPCTKCNHECFDAAIQDYQKDSFTIFAVGDMNNNGICGIWTINDAKQLINVKSDFDD